MHLIFSIRQRLGVRARLSLPHRNGGGYQVICQPKHFCIFPILLILYLSTQEFLHIIDNINIVLVNINFFLHFLDIINIFVNNAMDNPDINDIDARTAQVEVTWRGWRLPHVGAALSLCTSRTYLPGITSFLLLE